MGALVWSPAVVRYATTVSSGPALPVHPPRTL